MSAEQFESWERSWATPALAAAPGVDPRTLDTPENDAAEGAGFLAFMGATTGGAP